MNLNEILRANGISDEIAQKIIADMRENKVFTASEENLDIRYGKLKTQHEGVTKQLNEANELIEQLKVSTQGQEGLQKQVADYEQTVQQMQKELEQTRIDAAVKVALLSSHVADVDYLTFKLREKLNRDGETLTLDENGDIKGWSDKLEGLKTQFPNQFESTESTGYKVFEPNKLQRGDGGSPALSRESFRSMSYEDRLKLKQDNPELYKRLRTTN